MKKILVILCFLVAVQLTAQDESKLLSKIAKSDEEIQNPKKALQAKTWIARAELFIEVWSNPIKNVMTGMTNRDVKLALASEKIKETLQEDVDGTIYDVDVYNNKRLYYDEGGVLVFWQATYPVEKPLFSALQAYKKAIALDGKGASTKKIKEGLEDLLTKFNTDALAAYNLHNYHTALENFEGSLACSGNPIVGRLDTMIIYYAGLVARVAGDNVKALEHFAKALDAGYDQKGDLYATYAETLILAEDTTLATTTLTEGLTKYPTNQSIIIGLINIYLQRGDDPKKVLPYVEKAQLNDPENSSLYYAEGIVYEQLEDYENAILAYKKALGKDEGNFYANYAIGVLYFNKAVQLQNTAALEPDDKKYKALVQEVDAQFDLAIPFLERAYQLNSNERSVAESLKSIYFRLREKSAEMQQKYEFYDTKLRDM